jgi:REP element-mobilizing transposase RayT
MPHPFQFFDPEAEVAISHRRLPHWEQPGVTYFVTFRTADSIPEPALKEWTYERNMWLRRHGINPLVGNLQERIEGLPKRDQDDFRDAFSKKWHSFLDCCYGECVLRGPELSEIVAKSFKHFDGERYVLGDFVVMPNHVHLLAMFPGVEQLRLQCRSWKKYTAGRINEHLERRGKFWQDEAFDHIVRNPEQFEYFRWYIADNPVRARLCPVEYYHYRYDDVVTK